jgi:SRSO17 transposase
MTIAAIVWDILGRWVINNALARVDGFKGEIGLDHCEARSWHGWHRHMIWSMLASGFLAGLRARLKEAQISVAFGKANKRCLSAAA